MAQPRSAVHATANFERNLADVEAFLAAAGAPHAYRELLEALDSTIVPNLGRFPSLGRAFDWNACSTEAQQRMSGSAAALRKREFREHVCGDYLILYELAETTVFLLAIKHQRQLSFDLGAHWLSP